jgi:hypothetical protein
MRQRALMLLVLAAACSKERSGPDVSGMEVSPHLALPTADGGRFDPASLGGKRVLINFWTPG